MQRGEMKVPEVWIDEYTLNENENGCNCCAVGSSLFSVLCLVISFARPHATRQSRD